MRFSYFKFENNYYSQIFMNLPVPIEISQKITNKVYINLIFTMYFKCFTVVKILYLLNLIEITTAQKINLNPLQA